MFLLDRAGTCVRTCLKCVRVGEIKNLRWEWVKPPRLVLPDSKTGPKVIWLNSQAQDALAGIERREDSEFEGGVL